MITVKCGYEGCDWELNSEKEMLDDYDAPTWFRHKYLEHCEEKHGLKPAIWER